MATNYEKYFGTPEQAAESIAWMCQHTECYGKPCIECGIYLITGKIEGKTDIEWLKEECE